MRRLVLAAVGLTHPQYLDASTAHHWRDMHIALAFVFPLLAAAVWPSRRTAGRR